MKKLNSVLRILFSLGLVAVFLLSALFLWRLWRQSQTIDPQTLESLLPSLNIGAIKQAAGLLR